MSQPVKLSDALILDARLAGEMGERSIAGQVEFWARLGRSVEVLLNGKQVSQLIRTAEAKPLSYYMGTVDSLEGRERLSAYLLTTPFPHYAPAPGRPGYLRRTEENGTITIGRFVQREFEILDEQAEIAHEAVG